MTNKQEKIKLCTIYEICIVCNEIINEYIVCPKDDATSMHC